MQEENVFFYYHHDDRKGVNIMKNKLMMGLWKVMINVPPFLWEKQIAKGRKKYADHLAFMSGEHRLVHHFVVRELPFAAKPLSPEFIASALHIPIERTISILNDLEAHMTFIFRNTAGSVVWAYPVTVEKTPHQVMFHTGEQLYAA
jgi:hypothetical protein